MNIVFIANNVKKNGFMTAYSESFRKYLQTHNFITFQGEKYLSTESEKN